MTGRGILVGFLAGLLFAAAVIAGAVIADASRQEEAPSVIRGLVGDPIPILAPVEIQPLDGAAADENRDDAVLVDFHPPPYLVVGRLAEPAPSDAAELGILARDEAPARDEAGTARPGSATSTGGGGISVEGVEPAAEPVPDPGFDADLSEPVAPVAELIARADLGLNPAALGFFDFCADQPGGDCPPGFGATVLVPLGGATDDVGPLLLGRHAPTVRDPTWRCPTSDLGPDQMEMLITTSQPAVIEVRYAPVDDPDDVRTTSTITSDSEDERFWEAVARADYVADRNRVQHCLVLDVSEGRSYEARVTAGNDRGEVRRRTYPFVSFAAGGRPPVTVFPVSDHTVLVWIYLPHDGAHTSVLRLVDTAEGLTCTDIEPDVLGGTRNRVIPTSTGLFTPALDARPDGHTVLSARIPDARLRPPDWPWDPEFGRIDLWGLPLLEGTNYTMCIWWLRSDGAGGSSVVEREARSLSVPNGFNAGFSVQAIQAPRNHFLVAGSVRWPVPDVFVDDSGMLLGRVFGMSRSLLGAHEIEAYGRSGSAADIEARGWHYGGDAPFYASYRLGEYERMTFTWSEGSSVTFGVSTGTSPGDRTSTYLVHLPSVTDRTGLCGSGFGSCDPPSVEVEGPTLVLRVTVQDGRDNGADDWVIGVPSPFPAP